MSLPPQVETLLSRMLKKRMFVIFSVIVKPPEMMKSALVEHLEYMISLERQGILFGSGPYFDEQRLLGDGMTIIRADSVEEAREIADQDPMHRLGIRTYTIKGWQLNEGCQTIRITYSDSAYHLD